MLRPLTDRILIKPDVAPDTTESGLHLVQHWTPENSGEVVAVPERSDAYCPECGARVFAVPSVKVGDVVIFSPNSGQEVRVDGDRYLLMRDTDILCILETV
jgi:chaperonin GroES